MPTQPAYLTLNRHGTYYFRIVTPMRLRSAFDLQREIRRSLKTDSLRLALRRARQYAARFEAAFDKVLGVVDQDDYVPTDEDLEFYTNEMKQAESAGAWASHSSEPVEKAGSTISEEDWLAIDTQQRWDAIAELLTGNANRCIPESQRAIAAQIFAAGNGIPSTRFRKLLPKLLEELALQALNRPDTAVAAPSRDSAQLAPQPSWPNAV
ncbi:hypothetical protein D3C77_183360 [compost metagenome]